MCPLLKIPFLTNQFLETPLSIRLFNESDRLLKNYLNQQGEGELSFILESEVFPSCKTAFDPREG